MISVEGGNRADNSPHEVCRISEFHPSDFEWIFKIIIGIVNITIKSKIMLMDIFKTINTMNLKAVLLA